MLPFQQFTGMPLTIAQLGSGDSFQPFKTVEDYRNWLARIKAFSIWADSSIVNFKAGQSKGVVLPASLVKKTIPQLQSMIVEDPEKSLFYGPVNKFPSSFTEQQKAELKQQYIDAINTDIIPSYKKLAVFLEKEYLP